MKYLNEERAAQLRRWRSFSRWSPEWDAILPRGERRRLWTSGALTALLPADWPDPIPEDVPPPFVGELVEPGLVALRSIEDPYERARAIFRAKVNDNGPRAHELILSVRDAGWPGALAQTLLRPTPDEEAEAARAEEYRAWVDAERRRILRSMKKHSPELLRDAQMRAFPGAFTTRAQFGPSLLDVLDEL